MSQVLVGPIERKQVKGVTLGKNAPSIRSNKFNITVPPIADMFSFSYGAINERTPNDILYSTLARKAKTALTLHGQPKTIPGLICQNQEHRDGAVVVLV
jgi:hypothetical protein